MTTFWQHAALAGISAASTVIAALIGVLVNRKMTRIEIAVNGRVDALVAEVAAAKLAEAE